MRISRIEPPAATPAPASPRARKMTINGVYDGTPEVDYFSLHNRKPKRIDVDMLDYGYVAKSSDIDELKGILELLRSGKEGRYPQLETATEDRILALLPPRERARIEAMRAGPKAGETQQEREQLDSWTSTINDMSDSLQRKRESSGRSRTVPPVRGRAAEPQQVVPTKTPSIVDVTGTVPTKKQAIPAYDFRAWEKYDVDKALNELDSQEQQKLEQARLAKEAKDRRDRERVKELASLPAYIDLDEMSETERTVLARVEKEKGNDCFRANENEEAVLYYSRSIAFDDTDAVLYANRAAAHLRLKNFSQAEDDCTRAIELDNVYAKAWRRRGMTRFRRGKYAEAIDDFEHALHLEPGNSEVEKLLLKTKSKWREVDGTANIDGVTTKHDVSNNQTSHDDKPAKEQLKQENPSTTSKPFTRFEIIEEDDEDDDVNAPTQEDDEEEGQGRPFQRFEIIEE